jgi:hypothetical protein
VVEQYEQLKQKLPSEMGVGDLRMASNCNQTITGTRAYFKVKKIGTRQELGEEVFLPRGLLCGGIRFPLSLEGI